MFWRGLTITEENASPVSLTAWATVGVLVTSSKTDVGDSGRVSFPPDLNGKGSLSALSFNKA